MGDRGNFSDTPPGQIFSNAAADKKNGVLYLKGPNNENVFVIIKNGKARHVSGDLGEGDPALVGCFGWARGSFSLIEDITTDETTFINNVSDELAKALAKGVDSHEHLIASLTGTVAAPPVTAKPPAKSQPKHLMQPAIVFFGDLYTKLCFNGKKSLEDLCKLTAPDVFTGIIAAITPKALGYLFFVGGKKLGEATISVDGITACEGAAADLFDVAVQIEAFKYAENVMAPYIAMANGTRAVTRVPAEAVNIDKFILWAEESGLTCFIWINDNRHTANILIRNGKILGGLTELAGGLNPVIDDALAIFYSPDAEVEIFFV